MKHDWGWSAAYSGLESADEAMAVYCLDLMQDEEFRLRRTAPRLQPVNRPWWLDPQEGLDLRSTDWMRDAGCLDLDPDAFFPNRGDKVPAAVVAACERCPVRLQCREYATEKDEAGYWGGMSQDGRRKLKASRRAAS